MRERTASPGRRVTRSFASCVAPPLDVALLARADGKRSGRDVLANRRAGADVGAFADGDRRNQLRIAADEGSVSDGGHLFPEPVVVARDGAGTNVHVGANDGVAEIGEVRGLRSLAEHGLLQLHEVADLRARSDVRVAAQVRERSNGRPRLDDAVGDDAVIQDHRLVANRRIRQAAARVDDAVGADARPALERDARHDPCRGQSRRPD